MFCDDGGSHEQRRRLDGGVDGLDHGLLETVRQGGRRGCCCCAAAGGEGQPVVLPLLRLLLEMAGAAGCWIGRPGVVVRWLQVEEIGH